MKLSFAGYRSERIDESDPPAFTQVPVYVFNRQVNNPFADLPLHDHRDNTNGGFAFAVYHPGTSLPQKPWAL